MDIETSRTFTTAQTGRALGADMLPDGRRQWDYSGDCLRPVYLHMAGRPDQVLVGLGIEPDKAYMGEMVARCRKCPACLAQRSKLWAARACDEIACAKRTWFGTLTVRPEWRVRAQYEAELETSRGGSDWLKLSEDERFTAVALILGKEVGRMLKRVRKNSGTSFRYLLVLEAHKDGFPHFHLLVHEHGDPVLKRVLDAAWRYGFSQWRLVDAETKGPAFYVCKYLAKSALGRVKASQKYGQACQRLLATRVLEAASCLAEFANGRKSPPVSSLGAPVPVALVQTGTETSVCQKGCVDHGFATTRN